MRLELKHGYISGSSGAERASDYAICTVGTLSAKAGEEVYIQFPQNRDPTVTLGILLYDESGVFQSMVARQGPPIRHRFSADCLYRLSTSDWGEERVPLADFYIELETAVESVRLRNGYSLSNADIDDDPNYPQLSIERVPSAGEDGQYSIVRIRAPESSPKESTLALSRKGGEFTDITDMRYDERWVGVVVQARGSGTLCPYHVSFNDGGGIVDKLSVQPDALATELRSDGAYQDGAPLVRGYGGCRGLRVLSKAEYAALEAAGSVRTDILYVVT